MSFDSWYKGEDIDSLVIETLKCDMNIDMRIEQIDWTYIIESFKKDDGNRKSRPILMKLMWCANICNVFVNKNVLKDKNIRIYQSLKSLTKDRMRKLK